MSCCLPSPCWTAFPRACCQSRWGSAFYAPPGSSFVFQGAIVLLAQVLAPVLSDAAIAELSCCGSVMILAISLNLLRLTKIKTANLLPAAALCRH